MDAQDSELATVQSLHSMNISSMLVFSLFQEKDIVIRNGWTPEYRGRSAGKTNSVRWYGHVLRKDKNTLLRWALNLAAK